MPLDVYVGAFTRYYCGDWDNVADRVARSTGLTSRKPRPAHTEDEPAPAEDAVRSAVLVWRDALQVALGEVSPVELNWSESDSGEYFTDRPNWLGYGSLLLLSVYLDAPGRDLPETAVEDWSTDAVWKEAQAAGFAENRFQQVFMPKIWLPVDFDFVFAAIEPSNDECHFGSSYELLRQLEQIGAEAYSTAPAELGKPSADLPDAGTALKTAARFGLDVFTSLARKSVLSGLPMKLDY